MRTCHGFVVGALVLATGCRQILGIDDPTHDTTSGGDGGDGCLGADLADGGLIEVCQQPTISDLVIATAIDTDSSSLCATVSPPLGPPVCAIEALDIHVTGTIAVTGSRPLVVVAAHAIEIASGSILDVSSQLGGARGAGANDSSCPNGSIGGATTAGGSGGTFGTSGGIGAGTTGGRATPVSIQFVRGGCAGDPPAGAPIATAGPSGGAVYLIAGTEISIDGAIIAAGGGGRGGSDTGGGAGGGTGGLIGLDAPAISGTGAVFAIGGGGGEGGGGGSIAGSDGQDASDKFGQIAKGGAMAGVGGDGGNGAGYGNEAADGGGATGGGGGGGGGGGAGIVWVRGSLGLTKVSPAPSP